MDLVLVTLGLLAVAADYFNLATSSLFKVSLIVFSVYWAFKGRWQASSFLLLGLILFTEPFTKTWLGGITLVYFAIASFLLFKFSAPKFKVPSGPLGVGFTRVEYCYETNQTPSWQESTERKVQAYAWYPTTKGDASSARPYMSVIEAKAFVGAMQKMGMPHFLFSHLKLATTNSIDNAEITPGKFPFVVFNHGGALWPSVNTALMEHLASHGYIVFSIGHLGESAGLVWKNKVEHLSDKLLTLMKDKKSWFSAYASLLLSNDEKEQKHCLSLIKEHPCSYEKQLTKAWAQDNVEFVKAFVNDEFKGVKWLLSNCDKSKYAYVGMSIGGSTSYEASYLDDNVTCGINLDGMNWNLDRLDAQLDKPFLQLYADPLLLSKQLEKHSLPDTKPRTEVTTHSLMCNSQFYKSDEAATSIVLCGSEHMSFTDKPLNSRWDNGALVSKVNELCLAYLDTHLKAAEVKRFDDSVSNRADVVKLEN